MPFPTRLIHELATTSITHASFGRCLNETPPGTSENDVHEHITHRLAHILLAHTFPITRATEEAAKTLAARIMIPIMDLQRAANTCANARHIARRLNVNEHVLLWRLSSLTLEERETLNGKARTDGWTHSRQVDVA